MRILYGAVILAVGLGAGCSSRDNDPQTPTAQVTIAAHEAAMKQIQQAFGALNGAMKAGELPGVQAQAKILATQFTLVENFWTQRAKPDAVKFAAGARQGAMTMSTAADLGAAKAAQPAVAVCAQCHKVYREGMPGDYRIAASAGITQ